MNIFTKIRAIWKARKIINEAKTEVKTMDGIKPGLLTTEFWTKNIIQLVVLANMFLKHDIPPEMALGIVAALEGLYMAGRTGIKAVKDIVSAIKQYKTADKPAPAIIASAA